MRDPKTDTRFLSRPWPAVASGLLLTAILMLAAPLAGCKKAEEPVEPAADVPAQQQAPPPDPHTQPATH
jgi:hypothetical protein